MSWSCWTDGESPDVGADRVRVELPARRDPGGVPAVPGELHRAGVQRTATPSRRYRPDPQSARAILDSLAAATGGRAFDEADLVGKSAAGPPGPRPRVGGREAVATERGRRLPLAPYLAAVAILPLGLLLWRRDR